MTSLIPPMDTVGINNQAMADIDDKYTFSEDATCFPQGFPFICFLDGDFYGIYSWQIKKHRDNYQMVKNNYSQIHLDGMLDGESIFNLNGTLDWDIITGKKAVTSVAVFTKLNHMKTNGGINYEHHKKTTL